jgi:DNA-binding transcriptional MerR regulator
MQFSTPDTARLAGITLRQIRYWDKKGLVKPSAKTTGHRRYTFPDLVALKTIKALIDKGLSLQKLGRAIRHLRDHYPSDVSSRPLSGLMLLTDGEHVYLKTNAREIQEVMTSQTVIWAVAVGHLIEETQRQTDELATEWTETVMVRKHKYHLHVNHDPEVGGYSVHCRELPGAIEQGETPAEAVANGKDAIESVLDFLKRRKALRGRRAARA